MICDCCCVGGLAHGWLLVAFDVTSCVPSVLPGCHVQPRSAQQEPRGGDHGGVSSAGHQSVSGVAQTEAQRLPRGRCGQEAVVSLLSFSHLINAQWFCGC